MRVLRLVVLFSIAAGSLSCRSDSTGPGKEAQAPFSLTITVKDGSGTPRQGLRISASNQITFSSLSKRGDPAPAIPLATTMVGFEAASPAWVDLTVLDLDDHLVSSLLSHHGVNPGRYVSAMQITGQFPTRVYKCRLVARDTATGATILRDSIFAVFWQPDASVSILGWTGANGTLQTGDSLMFPHLLSLPALIHTDATGTQIGTFTLSDSVVFTITDTAAQTSQVVTASIKPGANTLQIVWNPSARSMPGIRPVPIPFYDVREVTSPEGTNFIWKLEQNYPNPFD